MTLVENQSELLFSYGTLRNKSVQLSIFGRRLEGKPDNLVGYRMSTIQIGDQEFAARNGVNQRNAQFTGNDSDVIEGFVFQLTRKELELADEYEPRDYKRVLAQMQSGVKAWMYVHTPHARESLD